MNEIVKTNGLTKRYGTDCPVKNLNMRVYENRIYGFLGPNVPRYEQKTLSIT